MPPSHFRFANHVRGNLFTLLNDSNVTFESTEVFGVSWMHTHEGCPRSYVDVKRELDKHAKGRPYVVVCKRGENPCVETPDGWLNYIALGVPEKISSDPKF